MIQTGLETAAEMYAATFAGQTDAYSVIRNGHWSAVREPLTPDVVLHAFKTNIPISGYVLAGDSTSHIAALDIDRDDGFELGTRFLKHLHNVGGVGYIERSARGCHTWTILDRRLPAIVIRRGLVALLAESGLPKDPKIELRPASDRLPVSDPDEKPRLGHCIRLATMPHHRTGRRAPLIDVTTGAKLSGRLPVLVGEIDLCDAGVFISAAERAPLPDISPPPMSLRYRFGPPVTDDSACDILRDLWGVQNPRPGRACKCPAHDDRNPSLSILADDQRAICKSPGCELSNDNRGRGTYELRKMGMERAK